MMNEEENEFATTPAAPAFMPENPADELAEIEAAVEEAEPEPPKTQYALLFELEYLAADARTGTFETLKKVLAGKKIDFNEADFARFSSFVRPEYYVDDLLELMGNTKLSSSKLVDDTERGIAEYLATNSSTLHPTLAKLIETAKEKGMIVAALTALPKAMYSGFVNKLGLDDHGVQIYSFTDADKYFPRADSWLKVAKEIEVQPRNTVSLVTTSVACKGALTAGMRCIAVPDGFTSYQDFGGAYSIIDSFEDIEMDDVFSIIPDEDED